jgi:hypothetical protein
MAYEYNRRILYAFPEKMGEKLFFSICSFQYPSYHFLEVYSATS